MKYATIVFQGRTLYQPLSLRTAVARLQSKLKEYIRNQTVASHSWLQQTIQREQTRTNTVLTQIIFAVGSQRPCQYRQTELIKLAAAFRCADLCGVLHGLQPSKRNVLGGDILLAASLRQCALLQNPKSISLAVTGIEEITKGGFYHEKDLTHLYSLAAMAAYAASSVQKDSDKLTHVLPTYTL